MAMGIIVWIALGFVAGCIGSALVSKHGEGLPLGVALGIVGAVIGGVLCDAFGAAGVTEFNVWSLPVAVIGATAFLWGWHAIRRTVWHA